MEEILIRLKQKKESLEAEAEYLFADFGRKVFSNGTEAIITKASRERVYNKQIDISKVDAAIEELTRLQITVA